MIRVPSQGLHPHRIKFISKCHPLLLYLPFFLLKSLFFLCSFPLFESRQGFTVSCFAHFVEPIVDKLTILGSVNKIDLISSSGQFTLQSIKQNWMLFFFFCFCPLSVFKYTVSPYRVCTCPFPVMFVQIRSHKCRCWHATAGVCNIIHLLPLFSEHRHELARLTVMQLL